MKYLKKINSTEEAVYEEYNVVYATDEDVIIKGIDYQIRYILSIPEDGSYWVADADNDYDASKISSLYIDGVKIDPPTMKYDFKAGNHEVLISFVDYTMPYWFWGNENIISAQVKNGLTMISTKSFKNCPNLLSIKIPNSVITIGDEEFYSLHSITSVGKKHSGASIEIPDSVTSLGSTPFRDCTNLVSVNLPDSIKSIDGDAFSGCI